MVREVENFYGVYLLYNENPQYKGRTYIGFTVNPRRRIGQHNKGKDFGGAKRTSGKGPWEMVVIVYGFPTDISALMFEWAWQHPKSSRRLKHIPGKRRNELRYDYCLRVVAHMLRVGPWCRMPLTFHWIQQQYRRDFPDDLPPPLHMAIGYGPITSIKIGNKGTKNKKSKNTQESSNQQSTASSSAAGAGADEDDDGLISMSQSTNRRCDVCHKRLQGEDDNNTLTCIQPGCRMESHTLCLARRFLGNTDYLIPVDGSCPKCNREVLWGDLIRKKRGCYSNLEDEEGDTGASHWTEELRESGASSSS